jgi:isopentenyldiphosphate isomerase
LGRVRYNRFSMTTWQADDELLDVLDDEGNATGERKQRDAIHRDGDWHRSFHLWVVKDGRNVLLQRRSSAKDLEAGKCDVTVGGHFAAGESLEGVLRESEEEIGLTLAPDALHFLGTRRAERRYPHALDREVQEVYVARCDWPLERYVLNCREVEVLYEVPLVRAIALYRDGRHVPAAGFDCYERVNNALLVVDDLIEQARGDVVEALERVQAWLEADT